MRWCALVCVCVCEMPVLGLIDVCYKTDRKCPRLIKPVLQKLLPRLRKDPSSKMMKKSDLTDIVKTSPEMPHAPDDTVEETVEFLHASGEVCIYLASLMELIQCLTLYIQVFLINYLALLDVPWMSHSLLGPVMAPPEFPVHLEAAAKSRREEGTATTEEICSVIRNFQRRQGNNPENINTEYAMNALETLGVMFELPDRPGVFCIPSHLPYKDRNEMWPKHPRKIAYVGRRIECRRNIDTFTSAFFVFLQSRLAVIVDR